jgi:hypothetical protein
VYITLKSFSLQLRSSRGSTSRITYRRARSIGALSNSSKSAKKSLPLCDCRFEDLSEDLTRIQSRIVRGRYNSDDTHVRARRVNVYLAVPSVFHLIKNFPKASATPPATLFFIVLLGRERPRSRSTRSIRGSMARATSLLEYTCVHR